MRKQKKDKRCKHCGRKIVDAKWKDLFCKRCIQSGVEKTVVSLTVAGVATYASSKIQDYFNDENIDADDYIIEDDEDDEDDDIIESDI